MCHEISLFSTDLLPSVAPPILASGHAPIQVYYTHTSEKNNNSLSSNLFFYRNNNNSITVKKRQKNIMVTMMHARMLSVVKMAS